MPGVQISSGAHFDYHRPTDTVDKVDADGLVKVAVFTKEAVGYLAQRPEPLTVTIDMTGGPKAPSRSSQQGGRRVSVGTVPDFAYQGTGVRVEAVVPGSPAAAAGIEAGDVLTSMGGNQVENLQSFTDLLKSMSPGDTVKTVIERDGKEIELDVTVKAR